MSTTQVEQNELPVHEFIRRQRLRSESISCCRRGTSSAPPPRTIQQPSLSASPSAWTQHRGLFITLLICLCAFHLLLGTSLHNLRFRTYARTHTSPPPSRFHFLTSILPATLFHPSPPPPPPPFTSTTLTHPTAYSTLATTCLHHLLALHAHIAAHLHILSSARHATYPATLALTHLHAALTTPAQTPHLATTPPSLPSHIQDILTATRLLEKASSRTELHHTLLAPELSVPTHLHAGLRAQRSRNKNKPKRGSSPDARLQTACAAASFARTLDAVEARLPAIAALAAEAGRAAARVDAAVLKACQGAAEAVRRTDLVCVDALGELWGAVKSRGAGRAADLEGLGRASRKAGVAAEALLAGLEGIGDEVRRQRSGVDVWVMFLEGVPGGSVEEKCKI